MLFKKGDPSDCNNYRPVTLLAMGYKLFATILLNRLREAGVDKLLWRTQFGFRRRTADAVLLARQAVEQPWAQKGGKAVPLVLIGPRHLIPYARTLLQQHSAVLDVPNPSYKWLLQFMTDDGS